MNKPTCWLVLLLAAVPGCSSVSEADGCVPEEQRDCQCGPEVWGFQTCNAAGTAFSACVCEGNTSATTAATTGAGAGGEGGGGGGPATCPTAVPLLGYDVVDAEYSATMDRMIVVSSSPAALHVIDAVQGTEQSVALALIPTSVSVSPDGLSAVVGHPARLSVVDLPTRTVTHFHTVGANVFDVVYASNGWVHAFPSGNDWGEIHSVEIATGNEVLSTGSPVNAGTRAKLRPDGGAMYGADNGLHPSDIERYDISQGPAVNDYDSVYHGEHEMCGDLWMNSNGARIFTRCGNVFRTSDIQSQDMIYDGTVGADLIRHLSHAPQREEVAFIRDVPKHDGIGDEDTVLWLVSDPFLLPVSQAPIPCVTVGGQAVRGHGRFIFPLADGSGYALLLEPEEGSASGGAYAVTTISP